MVADKEGVCSTAKCVNAAKCVEKINAKYVNSAKCVKSTLKVSKEGPLNVSKVGPLNVSKVTMLKGRSQLSTFMKAYTAYARGRGLGPPYAFPPENQHLILITDNVL